MYLNIPSTVTGQNKVKLGLLGASGATAIFIIERATSFEIDADFILNAFREEFGYDAKPPIRNCLEESEYIIFSVEIEGKIRDTEGLLRSVLRRIINVFREAYSDWEAELSAHQMTLDEDRYWG